VDKDAQNRRTQIRPASQSRYFVARSNYLWTDTQDPPSPLRACRITLAIASSSASSSFLSSAARRSSARTNPFRRAARPFAVVNTSTDRWSSLWRMQRTRARCCRAATVREIEEAPTCPSLASCEIETGSRSATTPSVLSRSHERSGTKLPLLSVRDKRQNASSARSTSSPGSEGGTLLGPVLVV
jgi:hypothetical protein